MGTATSTIGERPLRAYRQRLAPALLLGVGLVAVGVTPLPAPLSAQARFSTCATDSSLCADATGLLRAHAPLAWSRNAMSGGGAVLDFDGDGWQDLFAVVGGGAADALYRNNGDGTFTDVAAQAGVARVHRGVGAAAGDFDGDGDLDLFVTSFGAADAEPAPGRHLLYRNDGPPAPGALPTFTEVAGAAGVAWTSRDEATGMGAAFGDYDLDGDLDLFVAAWALGSGGNVLFRNDGVDPVTGTTVFARANGAAGLGDLDVWGFTPIFADMTGDHYPELLLAADYGSSRYLANLGGGTVRTSRTSRDATAAVGAGVDGNGMGAAVGDFDGDGLQDWFVTAVATADPPEGVAGSGNALYLNRADGMLREVARTAGVHASGWGWGAAAFDHDHDGRLDLAVTGGWSDANAAGTLEWAEQRSVLFTNLGTSDGGLRFADRTGASRFAFRGQGRGLVHFDYDNDGDQDVLIFVRGAPPALLRNEVVGPGTNWLSLWLDTSADPTLAPFGFGARVTVEALGRQQVRLLYGGAGYLTSAEQSAHFGLLNARAADRVVVIWPDGSTAEFRDVPARNVYVVRKTPDGASIGPRFP